MRKTKSLSFATAVLAGATAGFASPAMAIDTEIYLGSDQLAQQSEIGLIKPNVLLLLDTSGSMGASVPGTGKSRLDNMKEALKSILADSNNIKVGLMRFTDPGGPIIFPLADIDADAAKIEGTGASAAVTDVFARVLPASADDAVQAIPSAVGGASPVTTNGGTLSLGAVAAVAAVETTVTMRTGDGSNATKNTVEEDTDSVTGTGSHDNTTGNQNDFQQSEINGIRLPNVQVPQGARIISAYMFGTAPANNSGTPITIRFYGELNGNAAQYTASNRPVTDTYSPGDLKRPKTTASFDWAPENFTSGTVYPSAGPSIDLKAIVQEIVCQGVTSATSGCTSPPYSDGRDGNPWAIGNAMAFRIETISSAGKKRSFYTQNGAGSTVGRQTRLEIKYDNAQPGGTSSLGVRFTNIAIPQGAVIKHAHIEFVAAATSATDIIAPVFEIRGHKLTDAPTFANSGDKIDGRNKTTEMVEWSGTDLGAWVQNASYSTPDLTKVVQEMVDQSGWCGNNAMSFEVKAISGDTDARVAYSSDYVPPAADPNGSNGAYAPVLVVDIDEDAGNHGTGCINQVFTAQIAESEDDVEQTNSTGSMKLTDSSYDFNSAQTDAMRFRAVNIPKGANILSAELIVTTHKTNSSASTVTIKGEAADDSAQFTTAANNVTDRSTTSASTSWTLPNFDAIGRSVTSPDIAAVIQEIVDRSGWKAGNDLSLVFTTSGTTRSVKSWNNSPAESARLRIKIEYSGTVVPPLIKTVRERLGEIVDTYNASGYTPLVGQYFEAAQYYRGDDVVHGKRRSHRTEQKPVTRLSHPASYTGGTVDPAACQDPVNKGTSACYEETITGSPKYITPIEAACQSNYIVVLTDGEANHNGNDEDTDHLVSLAQTLAGGTCVTSSTGEKCGRDLAKFMATQDQNPTIPGDQIVKTYTIGFNLCDGELVQGTCCVSGAGTDSDGDGELDTCPTASVIAPSKAVKYLKDVAQNGLGSFFEAQTASQLASVFKAIFAEILTAPTSFATPSLSVNAFNKLFNRNQVYFSLFEPDTQVRWYGNVKKYNICDLIEFTGCTLGEILDASGTPAIGTDFRIKDSARSVWAAAADGINVRQGGAAAKVPASGERKVYTYTGSTAPVNVDLTQTEHAVADANTAITKTMLGDASMSDEERTEIIEWILGLDNADEDNDASTTERFKFEDPLHGSPVAVSYGGSESAPVDKLFVATNGGGLRMINPTSPTSADPDPAYAGREEWIFYPQAMLDIQKDLRANASGDHLFGLDLTPTVWSNDVDGNGKIEPSEGDFVRVIQAMRRGGNNIYAIDATPASEVTSPSDTTAIKPRLLWQIIGGAGGTTGFADLGQTWSQPKLATIRVVQSGVNVAKKVLIFGGGYDPSLDKVFNTSNQGAGVYVVDAATGALIASVGHSDGDSGTQLYSLEVPGMDFPIPADIATLDSDGDGAVDRLYFGDLGGNVWRVDLNDSLKFSGAVGSEVGVAGKLAKLAADPNAASTPPYAHANNTRKFHSAADVVQVYDTTYATSTKSRYDLVLIGSGAREDPLNGAAPNAANGIRDEFYALRDFTVGRLPDSNGDGLVDAFDASDPDKTFKTIVKSDLFDLTDDPFQGFVNGTEDLSSNATLAAALNSFKVADGWFMQLKQSNGDFVGEKVLSKPVVLAGRLFFTTYTPIASEADVESCKLNEGLGRLYGLNVLSGTALFASWDNAATTDKPTKGDRSLQLGGGIPSDAVPVFQKEGVTVIVGGGGGATTVDPGIALPRERTYWFEQGQ